MYNMFQNFIKVLMVVLVIYILLRIFIPLAIVIAVGILLFMGYKKIKKLMLHKEKTVKEKEQFEPVENNQKVVDVDYEDIR